MVAKSLGSKQVQGHVDVSQAEQSDPRMGWPSTACRNHAEQRMLTSKPGRTAYRSWEPRCHCAALQSAPQLSSMGIEASTPQHTHAAAHGSRQAATDTHADCQIKSLPPIRGVSTCTAAMATQHALARGRALLSKPVRMCRLVAAASMQFTHPRQHESAQRGRMAAHGRANSQAQAACRGKDHAAAAAATG
eukprot:361871-Chlamydomonas_euryale.AAC.16